MKTKVIITGSTGMVGKGVLLECLKNPEVQSVLVINRQTIDIKHEKLKELIHSDFLNLAPIEKEFIGYNTCFFCLGVSSAGMSEKDYSRITYDLTLSFAKIVLNKNPNMVFCYISGAGTDSSEKGRVMWARVKGKTENSLLKMPFKDVYMFRPGYIQPGKGIRSKTKLYNLFYIVMKPLYPVLKGFKKYVTHGEQLAKALIRVATIGYNKRIIENIDINKL